MSPHVGRYSRDIWCLLTCQQFEKNPGNSVLAKWEWSTGKVRVENKRIYLWVGFSLFSNISEKHFVA